MLIALIGNQNCGKSTLFNTLTGDNQHIGNFPGVTVDTKIGKIINSEIDIVDLPGIYSLNSYSNEEIITNDFICNNKIDLIINIVDSTNLERNLYLTCQLMKLNIPIILVCNMIDEVKKLNLKIDFNKLQEYLKLNIISISASKNIGIEKLISEINKEQKINYISFYDEMSIYKYIDKVCNDCINKNYKKESFSKILDKVFLNKYFAYPIFILIMGLIFYLTFGPFGLFLSDLFENIINTFIVIIDKLLNKLNINKIIISLVCDGILLSIGSVLSFIPVILLLFFFLSLLEDSGYMARVAFIMDKPLRKINLSGKSFVPLLLGFGCSVPSIMATRTLTSKKDRELTILLIPFMSCSAKLPVFIAISFSLFKEKSSFIILCLYLLGVLLSIFASYFYNKISKSKEDTFILELPPYRMPTLQNTIMLMIEKSKDFIKKTFSIIFVASIIIWFLQSFSFSLIYVEDNEYSILSYLAKFITPLFSMIGVFDWRVTASLIAGLSAKESVISTLTLLTNSYSFEQIMSPLQGLSLLVFILLYMPCIASFATMKQELKSTKKAVLYMMILTLCAYIVSALIFFLGAIWVY